MHPVSKGSPNVVVRFPAPLLVRLDRACEETGAQRSVVIRQAVEWVLKEYENPAPPPPPKRRRPKRR